MINSYLGNRSQAVIKGDYRSDFIDMPSGVPQGPHLILPIVSHRLDIYCADNKTIFHQVRSAADCDLLQQDLHNLFTYYTNNNITVSFGKCVIILLNLL